ncbi:MAG: radical SAM protein, partial [Lutispora sp.]
MQKAPLHMIYEAASRYNILALTSRCATSCVFCSHHQNPPEVEAFFVSDLTLDEAVTAMEFLDEDKKIIIGESATRLCEGEPFIHKDFIKILRLLREKYKNTPIQITTSGVYLDRETLGTLKSIGGIELNISLNSCTQEGREKLYRGRSLIEAVEAVKNIASYGISFNGSIVAMPHLVGERDIEDTIRFLSRWGAETIRVFMPGYTRYSKIPSPPDNIDDILRGIVTKLRHEIKTPLILEPTILKDLTPVVEGVVPDSPAHKAGFKGGEIITRIN